MFSIEPPISNSENYRNEFLVFYFLEKNINSAELQIDRIKSHIISIDKEIQVFKEDSFGQNSWIKYQTYLFIDIHFLLIAIANIGKNMEMLRNIMSYDGDFVKICKKHDNQIKKIDKFRDHLEHIIDRLGGTDKKGNPLEDPRDLGNLKGDNFTFGGDSLSLKSCFSLIEYLSKDIINWQVSKKLIAN